MPLNGSESHANGFGCHPGTRDGGASERRFAWSRGVSRAMVRGDCREHGTTRDRMCSVTG